MSAFTQTLVLVCLLIAPLSAKATIEDLKCRAALSALTENDRAAREMATDYFLSNLPTSEVVRIELISTTINLIRESYRAAQAQTDLNRAQDSLKSVLKVLSSARHFTIKSEPLLGEYLKDMSAHIDIAPNLDLLKYFSVAPVKSVNLYKNAFPNMGRNPQEVLGMLKIAHELNILENLPPNFSNQLLREITPEILKDILGRQYFR